MPALSKNWANLPARRATLFTVIHVGGGWAEYVTVKEGGRAKTEIISLRRLRRPRVRQPHGKRPSTKPSYIRTNYSHSWRLRGVGLSLFKSPVALRVIATASTANQDLLRQLGADVAIDYTKQKFEEIAKDVDCVLDPIGKDTLARSYAVVKKGGIILALVARPDPEELKKHEIRVAGIWVKPNAKDLSDIAQLTDAGKIKPLSLFG